MRFSMKWVEVLGRKFDWPEEDIAEVQRQIERFAQKVTPKTLLDVVKDDPDDNRILECASAAGSDYIVSGDKDLLRLGTYDSMRILNVSDFLELAQAGER
jgi:predicted nucleic acid-binding protein